jgi:tungstate transport system substrate-binding protein
MNPHEDPLPVTRTAGLSRRDLGRAAAGAAAAMALPAALTAQPAAASPPTVDHDPSTVRLGTVGAVQTGGLLNQLLAGFRAQHPYQVTVTVGNAADLYARARTGELDLVATHQGVAELPGFVADGAGRWPQLVVATVFAYIAAPDDPAGIGAAGDAVDAFERIAQTGSPFVVNNLGNPRFVIETLWHAAGEPDRSGWFVDNGLSGPAAVQAASQLGGYTLWGLHPFLGFQQQQPTDMRAVLFGDSLLQRAVASVVVQPGKDRQVNLPGALALEQYLLSSATQGLVRRFRHPQFDLPIFWPVAHHNTHE